MADDFNKTFLHYEHAGNKFDFGFLGGLGKPRIQLDYVSVDYFSGSDNHKLFKAMDYVATVVAKIDFLVYYNGLRYTGDLSVVIEDGISNVDHIKDRRQSLSVSYTDQEVVSVELEPDGISCFCTPDYWDGSKQLSDYEFCAKFDITMDQFNNVLQEAGKAILADRRTQIRIREALYKFIKDPYGDMATIGNYADYDDYDDYYDELVRKQKAAREAEGEDLYEQKRSKKSLQIKPVAKNKKYRQVTPLASNSNGTLNEAFGELNEMWARNDFEIPGFTFTIEDEFEDKGVKGYNIVYSQNGHDLVEVEVWEEDSPVTVVNNLWSPNLFHKTYDSFESFADELCYITKHYLDRHLTEDLSPEEKVDAWHDGTRIVKPALCSADKLKKYYDIAKAKGYTDICQQIADYVGEATRFGEKHYGNNDLRDHTYGDFYKSSLIDDSEPAKIIGSNPILADFYAELFPDDEPTTLENAKTDYYYDGMKFEEWLDDMISVYSRISGQPEVDVKKAIEDNPYFKIMLEMEFNSIVETLEDF